MEGLQALNASHIVQALTAINTPGVTSENIKIANDFLTQCEKNPCFATNLLTIYSEQQNYQLQVALLALFTNVIKRNWSSKRLARNSLGVGISPEHKQQLRKNILQAYMLHDCRNYKHFNNLIGYLARLEYPSSYSGLHTFIINSLNQLLQIVKNDLETVLMNNRVLVVLSTCKVIMKEYSLKKITHNEETFLRYISQIMQLGMALSQQLIVKVKASFDVGAKQASVTLLQCLRKIDKVILYGLGSITSIYQYKPEVKMIINSYVERVDQFNNLYGQIVNSSLNKICQQFQKYFIGIIQQLGKLQNYFPFAFSDILKQYLYLLLTILVKNVPNPKYYKSEKLLSVIITANFKPLTCFAYYMSTQQFTGSIYCRKRSQFDNVALQNQCNEVFTSTYNTQSVNQLLNTFITTIMTAEHILQDHKEFSDDLILQDCEIAIVDQPSETSVYQNCLTFVKNLIKCRKVESRQAVIAMINKVQELKGYHDSYNQQVMSNILEVILVLPYVYEIEALPIQEICEVINSVYEAQKFNYLARIIRKFHSYLPLQTVKVCFQILARVVATPISGAITPEIIYQSALALKTLMNEMDTQNIPVAVIANCISNIVSLVSLKQFIACPTLLWPIVNLIIKLVKSLYDINRELVSDAGEIIIRGLYPLLSSEKNQEMLVSALSQLMSTLLFCCFKGVKMSYHIRGASFAPNTRLQSLNKSSFIVFEAGIIFIKSNIRNRALQNYDTIYRFWLALIRSFPTIYEQQIYEFQLNQINSKLIQFFNTYSSQIMDDDSVVFTEILQEYIITELININEKDLKELIYNNISSYEEYTEQRNRIIMATASLYYSYSILRAPIQQLVIFYFKELIKLEMKVSSQANCLRTMLFLIIQHFILHHSAANAYQMFTMASEGNFAKWFLPYLWSMHFVSNKFAFKLNTAGIMKAISDISPQNYSQLLMNSNNNQLAIDEFLKVISIELNEAKMQFVINSYHNVYKGLVPNQLAPQFQVLIFRKTHLHFSDPILRQLIETNLAPELGIRLREIFACLDWTSADLEQRVGEKAALDFCTLLGWERKIV